MEFLPPHHILIYSDGACSGNPGPGGWASIVVTPDYMVTELGGAENATTNNRMEMLSALRGLEFVAGIESPIWFYTDSTYLIHGITKWVWGWQKRGWKSMNGNEVSNKDLWLRLIDVTKRRGPKSKIDWRYVRGHMGVAGNERCDEISVEYSKGRRPDLFAGPLTKYDVDVMNLPTPEEIPEPKFDRGAEKKVAHSYLSYVGGTLTRHADWKSCEAAVKGRPGAKFKKSTSAQNEVEIVREWGLDPARLKTDK